MNEQRENFEKMQEARQAEPAAKEPWTIQGAWAGRNGNKDLRSPAGLAAASLEPGAAESRNQHRGAIVAGALGLVLILVLVVAAVGHKASPAAQAAARISSAAIGMVANDGTTLTKAQCDPSTVQTWGDGSVSASCNDTFSDGTTATQTLDLLGTTITVQ
jgi:hypothetical protein